MKKAIKVTVAINKNWEAEGVLAALVNHNIRPKQLPFPDKLNTPTYYGKTTEPRAVFSFKDGNETTMLVTVRSIQDSMYHDREPELAKKSSSSSAEKYRILPDLFKKDEADCVISVSTAAYPSDFSANGSVVIGGNFFMYDGHPNNPKSELSHSDIGKLLKNKINPKVFSLVGFDFKNAVESKFLRTPNNPAEKACCTASQVSTALSVVNVTEFEEYNWVDHEALEAYNAYFDKSDKDRIHRLPCNSSETTHGVVKLAADKFRQNTPVIFISPITDQIGRFDFDLTPTQTFAASFNAGVALGQLLCELNGFVKSGNQLGK